MNRVNRLLRAFLHELLIFSLVAVFCGGPAYAWFGRVIDAVTKAPLGDALVTLNGTVTRTDAGGHFEIYGAGEHLGARAYGYTRSTIALKTEQERYDIELTPLRPKALYLSFYGAGSSVIRGHALNLIDATELNAVVIDVKGDRGMIPYRSTVPLAAKIGAQNIITIKDIQGLLRELHQRRIYAIARIVAFKDNPLATAHPELAVRRGRAIFKDREGLEWTDPFKQEVRDYNIAVAVEAARLGFDEIQFDYLRCPDTRGVVFSKPNTLANRVSAIDEFLDQARQALTPYNVFLAADIFGYVNWNLDDTQIGQQLEEFGSRVDYISPMLYPSGYQFGIPGYRNPVAHPYEIVYLSLKRARERTGLDPVRFRPWLQAFRDYAFDHRQFGGDEIRTQINAVEKFGSDGWMLWNPRNVYSGAGLMK
jgi:hypothetical protein